MIFQIDGLFINTDTITTISPYSREVKINDVDSVETGIIINGIKYGIEACPKTENVEEIQKRAASVVNTIINGMSIHTVQKLNLGGKNE